MQCPDPAQIQPNPQPGQHECDFSPEGEAGLHSKWRRCAKNPGHVAFIPINDFKVDHLPPNYRVEDFYNWIRHISDCTVRISVRHTSYNRPDFYPDDPDSPFANKPFPFANKRGSPNLRVGTGIVDSIMEKETKENRQEGGYLYKSKTFCSCSKCKGSPDPSTKWWIVSILTAAHVVYNFEEARHTTCDLWYDSDDDLNRVPQLDGLEVDHCDLGGDRCLFDCITCDGKVAAMLKEMVDRRSSLWKKVKAQYHRVKPDSYYAGRMISSNHHLTAIVSHPHGCPKHVTVGERAYKQKMGNHQQRTQYTYTTSTCPGTSGSPVCVLDENIHGDWIWDHLHSCACGQPGLNMSGMGLHYI